jgi:predicted acyl esterase
VPAGLTRTARAVVALALLLAALAVAPVQAAAPPNDATWTEAYIATPDGERLHADVLRPKGFTDADKTPVILIVSPYLGYESPTQQAGPSDRFYDFIEGARVFARGYSVVMVSLRGTGGSSGCLDILGPGEQTDVVAAVEWAASQAWSTGKVGMYGKSYDANTGVVGAALQPQGLAAVVAQQIAPDRYRGSYNDRVRLLQSLVYPSATYGVSAEGGFSVNSPPDYIVNSASRSADCQALLAEHYRDDEGAAFWRVRDFVERAKGSTVPTFVTAGYLDNATNIGAGALDFFNALDGPKHLWIGWWDHVRGNDTVGNRLAMGRQGFFDEVMRFFDHHVKGVPLGQAPTHRDPVIAQQDSEGRWRSETAFPARDATALTAPLLPGSFVDDGTNRGSRQSGPGGIGSLTPTYGNGAWTFSPPLPHRAHLAGIPSATVEVAPAAPRTNVVVNVYDVDPEGNATMVTRGAAMVDAAGEKTVQLWPTDWVFAPGHRIGLLVSGANAEAYTHVPTRTTAAVPGGTVTLPFLAFERTADLDGAPAPRLETYRGSAPFPVAAAAIEARTNPAFTPPPAQRPRPAQAG